MYDKIEPRDTFISYSSADQIIANEIVNKLKSQGVSTWMAPIDVAPGNSYADSIYYAIEGAPVFLVLMSANSNDSVHVARELEIADQMKKRVVPISLEEFSATGAFCYYTRAAHFYSWKSNPDLVLQRIMEQVNNAKT